MAGLREGRGEEWDWGGMDARWMRGRRGVGPRWDQGGPKAGSGWGRRWDQDLDRMRHSMVWSLVPLMQGIEHGNGIRHGVPYKEHSFLSNSRLSLRLRTSRTQVGLDREALHLPSPILNPPSPIHISRPHLPSTPPIALNPRFRSRSCPPPRSKRRTCSLILPRCHTWQLTRRCVLVASQILHVWPSEVTCGSDVVK